MCVEDGTCQPPGAQGGPCNVQVAASCATGLFCDRVTRTCVPPAARDQQCNPQWENTCAAGLTCHCLRADWNECLEFTRAPQATDVCRPALPDGQACKRATDCASGLCQGNEQGQMVCFPTLVSMMCLGPG